LSCKNAQAFLYLQTIKGKSFGNALKVRKNKLASFHNFRKCDGIHPLCLDQRVLKLIAESRLYVARSRPIEEKYKLAPKHAHACLFAWPSINIGRGEWGGPK
jgi:hypothetical protein